MFTDSLSRRLRTTRPNPRGKTILIGARDISLFEAIERHGPLPSNLLFCLTKEHGRDLHTLQDRLTKLYNGTESDPPYLTRPAQQFASYRARYQPIVYDLAAPARAALLARRSGWSAPRTDPFVHRLMTACVMASFELTASQRGLRFIHRDEILGHTKCPDSTRSSPNPLALPSARGLLIPDDLFGLQYPNGYRFFAVEIDRRTESLKSSNPRQSTVHRKVTAYFDVLEGQTYRRQWGVPNLTVLTITTSATRLSNIVRKMERLTNPLAGRFLFKADDHFGADWRIPTEPMAHLLGVWTLAHGSLDIATTA